jgi:hypothetical protein
VPLLDSDRTLRRHYYDEQYTNLAWQAAALINSAPPDRARPRWINYYGPSGSIRHLSYYQALEPGLVSNQDISNKVVFVGEGAPIIDYHGTKSTDLHKTPYTRWSSVTFPGVEIQATAFLNLVRHEWLSRLPLTLEMSLIFIGALGLAFALPMFQLPTAVSLAAACSLAVAALATLLAQYWHGWFCWTVISFVEAPAAVCWLALSLVHQRVSPISPVPTRTSSSDSPTVEMFPGPQHAATGNSSSPKLPAKTLAQGTFDVPDHELLRAFGKGSYGEVWLARTTFGTHRAVKIVFRNAFETDEPFEREFRGIQSFEPISRSHEGFVDILQVGRRDDAGYFYYVMELADSLQPGFEKNPDLYVPRTLGRELSSRQKIPCEETVRIGLQLAEALDTLHKSRLVHRDIKPSNIIFVKGTAKLADIGLVANLDEAKSFVGTEGFMPPEGPGSTQADIYSLGKVLYEIALGRDRNRFPEIPTAFAGEPEREQLLELLKILSKACDPSIKRRYETAEKMGAALKRLATRLRSQRKKQN